MSMRRLWSLLALAGAFLLTAPGHAGAQFVFCGFADMPACNADLSVALTPPVGTVYVGEVVPVTVTGSNTGPDSKIPVTMSVSAPGTVTPLGSTHTDGECVASCAVPFLPLSTGAPLQSVVHVRPEVAGPVTVTATIASHALPNGLAATDPNPANNTVTLTLNAVVGRCTSQIVVPDMELADSVTGSIGGDVITGDDRNDNLYGAAGDDCLEGSGGDDTISGGPGADLLKGGPGDDRIIGGPGHDRIQGNDGADLINSVDGYRDDVNCGFGKDRLRADQFDRFHGCEHVRIVHVNRAAP